MNRKIADGLPLLFQHTAARRRLDFDVFSVFWCCVSTHSRPKAAVLWYIQSDSGICVSTHSRPKAAALSRFTIKRNFSVSTHSRPKAAGPFQDGLFVAYFKFQHTAARRRLKQEWRDSFIKQCFNTQPPEGGWIAVKRYGRKCKVSTHSRPKAAVNQHFKDGWHIVVSTHSRPKAAGL